jgi:hypothetical protein
MPASLTPVSITIASGSDTLVLSDVLFGSVYVYGARFHHGFCRVRVRVADVLYSARRYRLTRGKTVDAVNSVQTLKGYSRSHCNPNPNPNP